ncbi:hypothetical protein PoB_004608300 [Plakobranchus ocellatus]|uniref:Uncharacterized protein n=1 Tax=Plakobranchus ocellatus TaxID=259542 RepID=A0AAV4BK86_9GAST|nr:hypothetical protein PoB_004608300 [Plakobranchus ocellatus]
MVWVEVEPTIYLLDLDLKVKPQQSHTIVTGLCEISSANSHLLLKKKAPAQFGPCCAFRAGGSRPFSDVKRRAWSPRLPHGSSEEHPHNFSCLTHGNSVTAPEDVVRGLIGPSARATYRHSDKTF